MSINKTAIKLKTRIIVWVFVFVFILMTSCKIDKEIKLLIIFITRRGTKSIVHIKTHEAKKYFAIRFILFMTHIYDYSFFVISTFSNYDYLLMTAFA